MPGMTFLLPRPAPVFRADPAQGRVFTSARKVQSTEVTPAGTAAARHAGPLPPAGGRRRCQRRRLGQLVPVAAAPGGPGHPGVPRAPGANFVAYLLLSHRPAVGGAHDDGERDGRGPYPVHRDLGRGLGETGGRSRWASRSSGSTGPRPAAGRSRPGSPTRGCPGPPRGGPGRCAPRTSTPPATSTTPSTGRPWRTSWPAWTGCPAAPSSNTTGPSCPAPSRSW